MLSPLRRGPRIAPIGLQQEVIQKTDAYKTASDALKTRICYVSQVVIFLVALIGLTIGLTVGYNEEEGMLSVIRGVNKGVAGGHCALNEVLRGHFLGIKMLQ